MPAVTAWQKRAALYLSICGLMMMVAAVSIVSSEAPYDIALRVVMIVVIPTIAIFLPWRAVIPAAIAAWLSANWAYTLAGANDLFDSSMLLELPGLIGVGGFAWLARHSLRLLENEDIFIGTFSESTEGIDPETGVYDERMLKPALEAELVRSRRFERQFALVLVGIDEITQRFDYRDEATWKASVIATAQVLRSTRTHIDRVYRLGEANFGLILPESGEREVIGLVRRLRLLASRSTPPVGQPGGPLPTRFGATFFPQCATTTDDLMRRAEVALRLADRNVNRLQIDGAEAPTMAPPETLRHANEESGLLTAIAQTPIEAGSGLPAPSELGDPASMVTQLQPRVELQAPRDLQTYPVEAARQPDGNLDPLEESLDNILERLDETIDMIRSLRMGPAA